MRCHPVNADFHSTALLAPVSNWGEKVGLDVFEVATIFCRGEWRTDGRGRIHVGQCNEKPGSLDDYFKRMYEIANTAHSTMVLRVTVLEFAGLWISDQ